MRRERPTSYPCFSWRRGQAAFVMRRARICADGVEEWPNRKWIAVNRFEGFGTFVVAVKLYAKPGLAEDGGRQCGGVYGWGTFVRVGDGVDFRKRTGQGFVRIDAKFRRVSGGALRECILLMLQDVSAELGAWGFVRIFRI